MYLGDVVEVDLGNAGRAIAILEGRGVKDGDTKFSVALVEPLQSHEAKPRHTRDLDAQLQQRLGTATSADRDFLVHDQKIRGVSLEQISPYTGPKFFIVDARAEVNFDTAMAGFDEAQHRIVRWVLEDNEIYPRRCYPTHPVHRSPELREFVPPAHLPVAYLAIESFQDSGTSLLNQ